MSIGNGADGSAAQAEDSQGFTPIDRISRLDLQLETTGRLAKMIAGAEPGTQLPTEKELCEQLGIGRSTLREALRSLSFIGAIERRQGTGTFVGKPSDRAVDRLFGLGLLLNRVKVNEVIEARLSLEIDVVRLASQRYTEADKQALTKIMEEMGRSVNPGAVAKPAQYDLQFHVALAKASQNMVFVHMINGLRSLLVIWMDKAVNNPEVAKKTVHEHNQILEALFSRNSDRAAACMSAHLSNAARRVLSVVGQNQSTADYIAFLFAQNSRAD